MPSSCLNSTVFEGGVDVSSTLDSPIYRQGEATYDQGHTAVRALVSGSQTTRQKEPVE